VSTVTAAPFAVAASPVPGPASPDTRIGRVLGHRFRILELIGRGGMGEVYRAKHLTLERDVCVKVLKEAKTGPRDALRFQREAQAAGRLRSAHAVQIIDAGRDEADGLLYIAMELIHGRNLKRLLAEEFPLGEERICHLVEQVLAACAAAHAQRVIHRDLKPANIMIEPRVEDPDFVKVLDFGVAKIQEPEFVSITNVNATCGTPAYMSPEQALGETLDGRSDLYSVGVILYQLATGRLPIEGRTPLEILKRHQTEMPIPPRVRRPEVNISAELEALILRALEKDPARRPPSAEAFREALLHHGELLRERRERTVLSERSLPPVDRSETTVLEAAPAAPPEVEAVDPSDSAPKTLPDRSDHQPPPRGRSRFFVGLGLGVATIALGVFWLASAKTTLPMAPPAAPSHPAVIPSSPIPAVAPAPMVARPDAPAERSDVSPAEDEAKAKKEKARRLVYKADPAYFEENFDLAERLYREAIEADPDFSDAYYGLFRTGLGASHTGAIREGGRGYLRLKPHGDHADQVREALKRY
jgi:serine/threonine-protein kinase